MPVAEKVPHFEGSAFVREALKVIGPAKPGDTALDLPCGAGRHSRHLADLGYHVVGADIDESFLQTARRESISQAHTTEWLRLDARTALPFKEGQFTVVAVIDYVDIDLLPRLIRLLKPGGYLIFQTFSNRGGNWAGLPAAGEAKRAVVGENCLYYRERSAGPAEVDRVTVRALWQRNSW